MKRKLLIGILLIVCWNSYSQKTFYKEYGGTQDDEGIALIQTNDKGFIIVGNSRSLSNGWEDIWIVKTSKYGEIKYQKNFGGEYSDIANDLVETSKGNILVIGTTSNFGKTETPNILIMHEEL